MNNFIYKNAYGILGLLPNSTQKEISKRIKEIEKLIQIEETPSYGYDFLHYNKIRTLQKIKEAQQNISNSKLQLLHYFFRIYVNSEKEISLIKKFDEQFNYENILEYYNSTEKKSFNLKKNVAIVLSLLLLTNNKIEKLEDIVDLNLCLWKEIIENNKSFKDFQKIYLLDDEIGINEKIFENLSENVLNELTNIFSDIARYQNNNEILSKFIEKFNLEDKTFNIEQVENIYKKIDSDIQTLKSMNISEDGIFDNDEKALLKQCLQSFQDGFNKLIDLNLYEHEKTIILRDLVATTIRIQILDLFNNLEEDETALNLMKFAIYIAGTEGLKTKLNDELSTIKNFSDAIITIKIGKHRNVTLYNKYLIIDDDKIYFEDIQSVSFLLHTTRTNGIETERTYNFTLGLKNNIIDLSQSCGIFSKKAEIEKSFNQLVWIATDFLIPIIATKLYVTLLQNKILRIGNLWLTKDKLYIRKWKNDKIVQISSNLALPEINEGSVLLFDETRHCFFSISLGDSNAAVLKYLTTMLIKEPVDTNNLKYNGKKIFDIKKNYGLHIFEPKDETDFDKKMYYFWDFLGDWGCLSVIIIGVLWIIISCVLGG